MKINFKKNMNKTATNIKVDYFSKEINLIPEGYIKKSKERKYVIFLIILFVSISVFIMSFINQISNMTKWYNHEIYSTMSSNNYSGLIEKINNLNTERESQNFLFALKKRIDAKADLVNEIEKTNKSIVYVIDIVEKEIPKGIKFKNMSVNSVSDISISCSAESNEQIAEFIHNLKGTNYFENVFVDSITKNIFTDENNKEKEEYSFNIICSYGGDTVETNE